MPSNEETDDIAVINEIGRLDTARSLALHNTKSNSRKPPNIIKVLREHFDVNVDPVDAEHDAAFVALHEVIGHRGIEAVLGKQADLFYSRLYHGRKGDIAAYAEARGLKTQTAEQRRHAAREWLADRVGSKEFQADSWYKRLVRLVKAAVEKWSRRVYSDAAIGELVAVAHGATGTGLVDEAGRKKALGRFGLGEVNWEQRIKNAFPNSKVVKKVIKWADTTGAGFLVSLPNGKDIVVDPYRDNIIFDPEKVATDWNLSKKDINRAIALGKFRDNDGSGIGVIELLSDTDQGTLEHEKFHALMKMVFTDAEQERILSRYGTEEKAAEAFRRRSAFPRGWRDKIDRFLDKLGDAVKGDVLPTENDPRYSADDQERVIQIDDLGLGVDTNDIREIRKAARAKYRELQKSPAHREDIGDIRFTGAGWKEIVHTSASSAKLKMIPALKEIVESASYVRRESLTKPRNDKIVAFHWLEANVVLDGAAHRVGVSIAEDVEGNKFYNFNQDLGEWEEKYGPYNRSRKSRQEARGQREDVNHPLSKGYSQSDTEINKKDEAYLAAVERGDTAAAQKMVEEAAKAAGYRNGPWYHWTDGDFSEFDVDATGGLIHFGTLQAANDRARGMDGIAYDIDLDEDGEYWVYADNGPMDGEGQGPFKTEQEAKAFVKKQPKRIKPLSVMLSINNPLRVPDFGVWTMNAVREHLYNEDIITKKEADAIWDAWQKSDKDGYEAFNKIITRKGYDGFIYTNEQEDEGSDSIVAIMPSQIKSADPVTYDDAGEVIPLSERFDARRGDIRYSEAAEAAMKPGAGRNQAGIEAESAADTGAMTAGQYRQHLKAKLARVFGETAKEWWGNKFINIFARPHTIRGMWSSAPGRLVLDSLNLVVDTTFLRRGRARARMENAKRAIKLPQDRLWVNRHLADLYEGGGIDAVREAAGKRGVSDSRTKTIIAMAEAWEAVQMAPSSR